MITDHAFKEHLTRSDVDFCIMVKNTSNKTFSKTIGISKELEHEIESIMENIFKEWSSRMGHCFIHNKSISTKNEKSCIAWAMEILNQWGYIKSPYKEK